MSFIDNGTLRFVASPGGTVILDVDDGDAFYWVSESLTISPADTSSTGSTTTTTPYQTQLDERFGGFRTDFQEQSNGTLAWTAFLPAPSPTVLAANIAALVAVLDSAVPMFIERQDPGWTGPLFYERHGPGVWGQSMLDPPQGMAAIDVSLPVAPAAQGLPITTAATITIPGVVTLGAVPGTLPALVDVELDMPAAGTGLPWGLVAPFAPAGAPLGVVRAPALGAINLALTADGGASSGQSLHVDPVVPGTEYVVQATVDPSLIALDGFERDVAVEVWIRTYYNNMQGATLRLYAFPPSALGAYRVADDLPNGKPFQDGQPPGVAAWRIMRVGVLRLPSEPGSGNWTIWTTITPGASSYGPFSVDYLALVPARHRACSPTGVSPTAGGYPLFFHDRSAASTKGVKHDGHGTIAPLGGAAHSDTGLGGAPLRIQPGPSGAVLITTSPAVPDDPTTTAGGDTFAVGGIDARVTVTPRYSLWSAP